MTSTQLAGNLNDDEYDLHSQANVLASISHEVRTPLHAIMGLSSLIEDEPISQNARRHLEKIRIASEALLQTLNTSIDAARAGHDTLFVEQTPFDVQKVCETAIRMFALNAEAKNLDLNLNFDSRLLSQSLIGDPNRLLQILSNLIGNAVKFTERGQITLWVVLRRNKGGIQEVYFSVNDTGIGIPDKYLERIAERYVQVEHNQKGRPQGSGLGLYITKKVIRLMGGELSIKSSSSGSQFSFLLNLPTDPKQPIPRDLRCVDNMVIRVIAKPGVVSEVLRDQLAGLGAHVEYYEALKEEILTQRRELTFVDYPTAKSSPKLWAQLTTLYTKDQLVLLCSELAEECLQLEKYHNSWFSPYLPSELITYLDSAGLLIGHQSRTAKFENTFANTPLDRSEYTLLAVDDSPTNMIVLQGALDKLGYTKTVKASNGQQAFDHFHKNQNIDLILMDINMPVMNGIEATQIIRGAGSKIPIVGLTALSEDEITEGGHRALFDLVLTKPVSSEVLAKTVDALLSGPKVIAGEVQ